MSRQNGRVFILSLDGATFDVLYPLIRQGCMPNLERVLASGLSAELESVVPPVTAPAWTSFMTGKNPNKHGIFDFTRLDLADYSTKLNNAQHIRSKTIWQILTEKKKRSVVLNLPYIYPTYEVNGVLVAGWDAPTTSAFTYPEELSKEILEVIPDYGSALDLSLWGYLPAESDADFNSFVAKLIRSFEESATLASHFLKKEKWDVFMVHFQQTDWIQHKLWGYIERACLAENDRQPRLERVRECYRTFDGHIGRLLEEIAPLDPLQIILSDHGFGPNRGTIYPNHMLHRLGHYQLKDHADHHLKRVFKSSSSATVRNLYRLATGAKTSLRKRQAVKGYRSWADMVSETIPREKTRVDWSRTKAAFVGGSEMGFVYVNLKGRASLGCVAPGQEYEQLVLQLIAEFSALEGPRAGEKLFQRVARGTDMYAPPADGVLLPDLVLIPQEGYVVGAGMLEPFAKESGDRGDHRHNGILLLQGPGVVSRLASFRPNLIDLAPTILHAVGEPVPADMDGRVLEEIFTDGTPVQMEDVDNSRLLLGQEYADTETELIEHRLRGLGYVE